MILVVFLLTGQRVQTRGTGGNGRSAPAAPPSYAYSGVPLGLGRILAGAACCALAAIIGHGTTVANGRGARTISLYNIHTKETITVVYKKDGKFVPAAMERVNWALRDWRRNEPTTMDPELVDLLWEIHNELGSKEPIHIISGYRSPSTNSMLRATRGGQAEKSQHIQGKAADVRFPDVPLQRLRYSALIRERGGVGYYPTSALPFVHVDTARVRAWPRLPRHELALLFPNGSTRHVPADGSPLTREDAREARRQHDGVARQVAEFHALRQRATRTVVVAEAARQTASSASPRAPRTAATEPDLIEQPRVASGPSPRDRARLGELMTLASMDSGPRLVVGPTPATNPRRGGQLPSLTGAPIPARGLPPVDDAAPAGEPRKVAAADPAAGLGGLDDGDALGRFNWSSNGIAPKWVPAAEYDEEHPEELSYRPFPIAPFLTHTADAPLMAELAPHDPTRTLEMLHQAGTRLPLRFRPNQAAAARLWSGQFEGSAMGLTRVLEDAAAGDTVVPRRAIRTSSR